MTRSRKSTARTQRSVSVEFEDTEVMVFDAQGGQLKATKNSICDWNSLEAQSGMTHLVFSVDGPVGAGSSPDQNKSSGSGVKHLVPNNRTYITIKHVCVGSESQRWQQASYSECPWDWRLQATQENTLWIGKDWSLLLGPCWVWSARGTIYT